jgi:hypothetical protein
MVTLQVDLVPSKSVNEKFRVPYSCICRESMPLEQRFKCSGTCVLMGRAHRLGEGHFLLHETHFY